MCHDLHVLHLKLICFALQNHFTLQNQLFTCFACSQFLQDLRVEAEASTLDAWHLAKVDADTGPGPGDEADTVKEEVRWRNIDSFGHASHCGCWQ